MNNQIFPPAIVGVRTVQNREGDLPVVWEKNCMNRSSVHPCVYTSIQTSHLRTISTHPNKNPNMISSSFGRPPQDKEDNVPYGGIFSTSIIEPLGSKPRAGINDVNWLSLHIISCAVYARQDLECECFLKVDDCKPMKSDCVSVKAPEAIVGDWKLKAVEYADEENV